MEKNVLNGPAVGELWAAQDGIVAEFLPESVDRSETEDSLLRFANGAPVEAVEPQHERTMCGVNVKLLNVIFLGLGFMFNIGAILTTAMAQTVVLNSVFGDPTLGYICLAVNCATQALAYLLGPSICLIIGPKTALILGSIAISANIALDIKPVYALIYPGAAVSGFGVGIVWAVQGYFVTSNSRKETIERNTGIFWGIFQFCLVTWNLFYYLMLRGATTIDDRTRIIVFSTLLAASCTGTLILCLISHPWTAVEYKKPIEGGPVSLSPVAALGMIAINFHFTSIFTCFFLVATVRLGVTKNMLILIPHFFYIGFTLTFWSNVYGTALGYTKAFGDLRESIVGLNGVFQGVGEITGGVLLGVIGGWSNRNGRDVALVGGLLVHFVAFYLIFLNVPFNSPLEMTSDASYIGPSPYLALFCTVLIGFGDAIWNNQLMAYLGSVYPYECVPAFGVYQFVTAVANAVAFGYSSVLTLQYQLLIMVVTGVVALAGYCTVEWKSSRIKRLSLT